MVRVAENEDHPLSRSATICYLLAFALALHIDERAVTDFIAFHIGDEKHR